MKRSFGVLLICAASAGCSAGRASSTAAATSPGEVATPAPDDTVGARKEDARAGEAPPLLVTLHVMSKCPYGVPAMHAWAEVAREVGPAVELRVEHIGREIDGQLSSMHGDDEVLGDIVEACVQHHAPYGAWLEFLGCFNEERQQIPLRWEECARRAQLDVRTVRLCYEGAQGRELLRASFLASERAGARGSPTMFVGATRYTGGRTVAALSHAVCAELEQGRSPYCDQLPPLPPLDVTILEDRRCTRPECDVAPTVARVRAAVPRARFTRADYRTREGRALFDRLGLKLLPAAVVDRSLADDPDAIRALGDFRKVGDSFVGSIGRFDPRRGLWVARPEVPVTILSDARCKTRECTAAERFAAFLERQMEGAKIERLDYSTSAGLELWTKLSKAWSASGTDPGRELGLPLAVFGAAVEQEEEVFDRLRRRFRKVGDEYVFQLGPWDPTAEVCDNGVDDDGDRRVDCRDPDCREKVVCRPEKRRRLDLFMMSGCPFAAKVLDALGPVLDHFGRDRRQLDLQLHYIGEVSGQGELSSMHGEWEVDEDLRQVCAQRHYAKGYLFMDYVRCRAKSGRSPDWEQCVGAPMKVEVIRRCAEGAEGRRLLRASFEHAKTLEISGSPSWLLNNRYEMEGREPEEIRSAYCERNDGPGCDRTIPAGAP